MSDPITTSKDNGDKSPEESRASTRKRGPILDTIIILRNRIVAGFFVALPFIITFIVVSWLYDFIARRTITPLANWISKRPAPPIRGEDLANPRGGADLVSDVPVWLEYFVAPALAIGIIIAVLFLLGMFFRSRTHRFFDWLLKSVPFVGTIYSAVSNAVDSLSKSGSDSSQYKRVVLINFPHAGMKVPAFVTSSCRDASTGKSILCVYVPTTPVPTSGYMLLVPEEDVTEISWDLSETLQAIVSGGITVPDEVEYYKTDLLIDGEADLHQPSPENSGSQIPDAAGETS